LSVRTGGGQPVDEGVRVGGGSHTGATVLDVATLGAAVAIRCAATRVSVAPTKGAADPMLALPLALAAAIMLTATTSLVAAAAMVSSDEVRSWAPSDSGTGVVSDTGSSVPKVGIGDSKGGVGDKTKPLTSMAADGADGAEAGPPAGPTCSASTRPTGPTRPT